MSFIVQNNDSGKIHHEIAKVRKHEDQYTFKKILGICIIHYYYFFVLSYFRVFVILIL